MARYPQDAYANAIRASIEDQLTKRNPAYGFYPAKAQVVLRDEFMAYDDKGKLRAGRETREIAMSTVLDALHRLFPEIAEPPKKPVTPHSASTKIVYAPEQLDLATNGAVAVGADGVNVLFLGEKHDFDNDKDRGDELIIKIKNNQFAANLIIKERGMDTKYNLITKDITASEETFSGGMLQGWGVKERSILVAGYLYACLTQAQGPLRIAIFFGSMHEDIFDRLETIIEVCYGSGVGSKTRKYFILRSCESLGPNFDDFSWNRQEEMMGLFDE